MSGIEDTPAGARAHLKTVEEFHTMLTKLRAELAGFGGVYPRGQAIAATDAADELQLVDAIAGNVCSIIAPAVDEREAAAEQYAETLGTVTLPDGRTVDYSLANVRDFRDVTVTVEKDNPGRRRGTTTQTVRVFLSPDVYDEMADQAAKVAQTLGIGIQVPDEDDLPHSQL